MARQRRVYFETAAEVVRAFELNVISLEEARNLLGLRGPAPAVPVSKPPLAAEANAR